jgi:hypothetical protein
MEVIALLHAKRLEVERWKRMDNIQRMQDGNEKWIRIANYVKAHGRGVSFRDNVACYDKWGLLNDQYKKIADYSLGTGNNTEYWTMDPDDRFQFGLPKHFVKEHYELMREFLNDRPIHEPPYSRDTMDASDTPMEVQDSELEEGTQERNRNDAGFEDFDLDLNDDPENHHTPESLHPPGESSGGCSQGPFEEDVAHSTQHYRSIPTTPRANASKATSRENRERPLPETTSQGRPHRSRSATHRARNRDAAMQDSVADGPPPATSGVSPTNDHTGTSSRGIDEAPPVPQHGSRQRHGSTGVPRKFQPQHAMNEKLVQVTETGAQELVQSINNFTSTHSSDSRESTRNLIEYFQSRDRTTNRNQEGLVAVLMTMDQGLLTVAA